jgi:hypothetical protein
MAFSRENYRMMRERPKSFTGNWKTAESRPRTET